LSIGNTFRAVRALHNPISAIWPSRWLLLNFIVRDIKSRYVGSYSGLGWALLQPLILLAVYHFVFTVIFKIKFPELGKTGFITFLAVALWPWLMFQEAVQRSIMAIQSNAGLIRKVAFPRELLVYATVVATFAVHLAGYFLVLAVLYLTGEPIQFKGIVLAFPMLFALFLIAIGLGLILSAMQVIVRDIEHIVGPFFMVLFYATPILYPLSFVPENLRGLVLWNPLTLISERLRDGLLGGALPAGGDMITIMFAGIFLIIANLFFQRIAPHFEDFL
jgi:lipopolysaccharide transport system permease protein